MDNLLFKCKKDFYFYNYLLEKYDAISFNDIFLLINKIEYKINNINIYENVVLHEENLKTFKVCGVFLQNKTFKEHFKELNTFKIKKNE